MKHKKIICTLLAAVLSLSLLSGCDLDTVSDTIGDAAGKAAGETSENKQNSKEPVYEVGEGTVSFRKDMVSQWVSVAVPIKNTGAVNLYLSSCSIDLEDEDGKLVDTLELVSAYPEVLQPNETAYYYEETIYEGEETKGIKAIPHVKVEKAKVDCIRYELSEIQVKDTDYLGVKITGRVKNVTEEEGTMVYIVANLFDKDGAMIGQAFTILSDGLAAGDKVGFEISTLTSDLKAKDIASYEIYAFPSQYQF